MGDVINLRPHLDTVSGLRLLADSLEKGEIAAKNCTVVIGEEVYHFGKENINTDKSAAVFNLNYGMYLIMRFGLD